MTGPGVDDAQLRAAMKTYVAAAEAVDRAGADGLDDRELLDLAEHKAIAGMAVRKRLGELGWSAPLRERAST